MVVSIRKRLQIVILVMALVIISCLVFFTGKGKAYKNYIVDADTFNSIIASKNYDSELLADITFNDQELFYDGENDFYLYSIIQGTRTGMNPKVYILDKDGNELRAAFLDGTINDRKIEENRGVTFAVYNDSSYYASELRFTTLPIVSINTYEDIPDYKEAETGMDISVYDNRDGVANRLTKTQGTVHVRGATSLANPKKNLKLSLKKTSKDGSLKTDDRPLLGMRSDDDWILNALYTDPEKVREVFSAELWKKSVGSDNHYGLDTGVEYRYVEVFLNGCYNGLYALGYPLEASQLGIKTTYTDKALFRKRMPTEDTVYLNSDGSVSAYTLQSNQNASVNRLLRDYMVEFDGRCDDVDSLSEMVDADNLADYFLYVNLIQGWDSIYKNQNLRLQREDGLVKALYIPWDMDFTWGVGTDRAAYSIGPEVNFEYKLDDPVYRALQMDGSLKTLMKDKYVDLRKTSWSDKAVTAMLDQYEKDIYGSGAFLREQDRWSSAGNEASEGLTHFKDYVLKRFEVMDSYVENFETEEEVAHNGLKFGLDPILTCAGIPYESDGQICILHVNDSRLWEDEYYKELMDGYGIPSEYVSENISLKRMLVARSGDERFDSASSDTDMILFMDGDAMQVENFFTSGSVLDTARGQLAYYEGDDGTYGLYLDGNEILAGNVNDRTYNLRLICVDAESLESIENYEYSF